MQPFKLLSQSRCCFFDRPCNKAYTSKTRPRLLQKRHLLLRRCPPQNRIPVREPPEAGDDVAMGSHPAQAVVDIVRGIERHPALLVFQALGMLEGQIEEIPPVGWYRSIEPCCDG